MRIIFIAVLPLLLSCSQDIVVSAGYLGAAGVYSIEASPFTPYSISPITKFTTTTTTAAASHAYGNNYAVAAPFTTRLVTAPYVKYRALTPWAETLPTIHTYGGISYVAAPSTYAYAVAPVSYTPPAAYTAAPLVSKKNGVSHGGYTYTPPAQAFSTW